MSAISHTDVVVIGGGPAGSTASTLIAKKGHSVQLFEREHFPRFHIGESLIPETYHVLNRLDMGQQARFKPGLVLWGGESLGTPFEFPKHIDEAAGHLHGLVDWGSACAGDPAVDVQVVWSALFTGESRAAFVAALDVDAATLSRSRGAAIQQACAALPYYLHTYPLIVERSWQKLAALGVPPRE